MINFVTLKASDLEKTADTFRALGYEFISEQHGSGPEHLASTNAALVVEIYPSINPSATGVLIGVEAPSLETVAQRCKDLNVVVKQGIAQMGEIYRMILQTPEGAEIFVQETPT